MDRVRAREIDLAGKPTNRATWFVRLVVRLGQILFWLAITTVLLPFFVLARRSWAGGVGGAATFLCERLGATFIKIGQIVSTRPDVFPAAFVSSLAALQDRVPPFRFAEARAALEEDFGRKLEEVFAEVDPEPVASGSVAQVHRAVLQHAELPPTFPSRVVAIKVRRPGIVRRAYLDEAILRFGARLLSFVPGFSLLSPLEAVGEFCEAVNKQLDFRIEAESNRQFRKNFENDVDVVVPALVDPLCSDRVLTMEFVDGVKVEKIRAVGSDPEILADTGIKLIGRMIFHHGFIHADLHPGNILYLSGNRLAILDLGLIGILDAQARRAFALLMYYAVHNMGAEVARWFYDRSPVKRVRDYPAYERQVSELLANAYDRPLAETQVTALLFGIFDVFRRHRIRTEATFTMPYIAIAVLEGVGRRLDPKRNLARDIRPFVESALALSAAQVAEPPGPERAMPTAIAGGRYRIRRILGEGARKRVYLARDARLDRDVAVALIRAERLDRAALDGIHLEARSVARLADHPRIVPVYDSGEEDGAPYVVSQYMAGGTLSGRLLRATEHRIPLDTALRFADQILQALEHAHAHGVIHRDVKPENVWLTEDGFAKLGDFGLARVIGKADPSAEGTTVGTALYMAPEQALGRGGDHRSDLYSFGASLYELLTGRPPFEGESVAEVIARQIQATPEPPSLRNSEIPAALDALVLKLLEKQPERRFESATAVRQALRELAAPAARSVRADEPPNDAAEPHVFVGREQEIAKLRKGLDEALSGNGRLFVLVGEPGIGKTRAAELLASYASRRGCLVLTGRSFEGEGAPAFWPWVQILRSYIEVQDTSRLESELGGGAATIAQIVPEVRERFPGLAELSVFEGEEARFRLFDAVTSFLKRAAAMQPLVLVLDDLHWADKPSLLLLQFVARELAGTRLLVIGTYRDVEVQYGHPLTELLPALRRERVFERILLRGLPEEDVRALVLALAGADVPGAFVRAIYRETEGNPFFIEETLRHLAEEGVFSREGGRWVSRISPDEIGLPEGVREVIGRRLSRLSAECRKILSMASVLGRDFDARALEQVSQLEGKRTGELLEEAVTAQLIETEARGHRHRFTHALVRETLYAELGAGERVRLHKKIADALFTVHGDDPAHLAELAYHACEAGPAGDVDRAIELARRAAEHADAQFAYEEAVGFYERALRALETKDPADPGRQCELLVGLGVAQWNSGDIDESKGTLRHAADVAERSGRAETLARAALLYAGEELQGMFAAVDQDMVPLLERALAALPEEAGALRAMVMGRLAGALTFTPQQERKYALFDEAVAIANRIGDKRALATVYDGEAGRTMGLSPAGGDPRGSREARAALRRLG